MRNRVITIDNNDRLTVLPATARNKREARICARDFSGMMVSSVLKASHDRFRDALVSAGYKPGAVWLAIVEGESK